VAVLEEIRAVNGWRAETLLGKAADQIVTLMTQNLKLSEENKQLKAALEESRHNLPKGETVPLF
jgi:hypothetical protein